MPIPIRSHGPGKYDDACTMAREATGANAAVLIIIDGSKGHGFSVQTRDERVMFELPTLLRILAKDIEAELTKEGDDGPQAA